MLLDRVFSEEFGSAERSTVVDRSDQPDATRTVRAGRVESEEMFT
jgi:hypothetical protein